MSLLEFFLGALLVYSILRALTGRREEASNQVNIPRMFAKADIIFFKAEEINGIFYLWNKKNNDFLAQGNTIEKAIEAMIERFPDKVFRSDDESHRGQN